MAKELERDLGLYAVITVSVGAMIGSGIFVLPGLAAAIGGPAVVLAYLLAGVLVLPAALSKAEMATALPQSGGTYLYIDRAMGPMMGTIAGLGVWFSLVFKSAFALVGLGAYLVIFTTLSAKAVALVLAAAIVLVNIMGVKKTGQIQAIVVTVVLIVLTLFVGNGIRFIEPANLDPFFSKGLGGVLGATGFVYVSYAGVTKIASVAEEVEDPGRNIPRGMLISVGLMMVVYTLVVLVIVGTLPPAASCPTCAPNEVLGKYSLTPMADAAGAFLGPIGVTVMAGTAILALASMANAGVLSSSRYPLAMSRDRLAPAFLKEISERFQTPTAAILLTGGLLAGLVAVVPVAELAKLASAFKILVFILINVALIAFREGEADWYEPSFKSPWYPWVQFFGILGGGVLLTQMGALPMIGAALLIFGGLAYFQFYVKGRTVREGVGVDALRRQAGAKSLEQTRQVMDQEGVYEVLIPLSEHTTAEKEALLLRLAADVVRAEGGRIRVIQFEEVPDQTVLPAAVDMRTPEDIQFEAQSGELIEDLDVPVEIGEVVSHDTKRAVVNYAKRGEVDLILADAEIGHRRGRLFGSDLKWLVDKAPCEVALVKRNDGLGDLEGVAVVSDKGPFDPFKVRMANAIAMESGAPIYFLHALDLHARDAQLQRLREYHEELDELCTVPTKSIILREEDKLAALVRASRDADLVIMEGVEDSIFSREPMAELPKRIAEEVGASTMLVYPERRRRKGLVSRTIDRVLYE